MSTSKQTQDLAVGDVIRHPAEAGTVLRWDAIVEIEESPHGEWAIEFPDGTVMIAEYGEDWPVEAPAQDDAAREAVAR